MTTLTFTDFQVLSADLGGENCMPDIRDPETAIPRIKISERVSAEDRADVGRGVVSTILPYMIQDSYNRKRALKSYKSAVLENDFLRAVFVPELGGRLWSLYSKKEERELLFSNNVFQPANLALRNAWFCGGVEWNIGIIGHTPLTCSPLFAAETKTASGEPVLRMYEYERIRDVVYSLDVLLPADSETLYVKVTIENTRNRDKYMYWWSNIAVPEEKGSRVIAPAREAFVWADNNLDIMSVPRPVHNRGLEGIDTSYTTNLRHTQDYFFRIPKEENKWIATADKEGKGLLQFSTGRLYGRKVFMWGQGTGGKTWNEFLSEKGRRYIEIQAGLVRTQMEHFIMEASSRIEWVEGYSALRCDPVHAHSEDWDTAVSEVRVHLSEKINAAKLEDELFGLFAGMESKAELKYRGSGWGCLENKVRRQTGQKPVSDFLEFSEDSLSAEQGVWLELLSGDIAADKSPMEPPVSYICGSFWADRLEESIAGGHDSWYARLQLGILRAEEQKFEEAYACFAKSAQLTPNPWAYGDMAMLEYKVMKDATAAVQSMKRALMLCSAHRGLAAEAARVFLNAGDYEGWLQEYEKLADDLKTDSRIQLYASIALIESGRLDEAMSMMNPDFVLTDVREGEVSVSDVWQKLYRKITARETGITDEKELAVLAEKRYPIPQELDFRMKL